MLFFFFFNDTATTEIYTLSLHDALPISGVVVVLPPEAGGMLSRPLVYTALTRAQQHLSVVHASGDRKSTRLNSSHANISYAVFCLKKKNIYFTSCRMSYIQFA